jgi:hypothetical protein
MNPLLYAFDMEAMCNGKLWDEVVLLAHPDDLLYAVWANVLNGDSYFLDEIFENNAVEDSSDANETLCNWVDQFYTFWGDTIYKIKIGNRGYELATCKFLPPTYDLFVQLRLKDVYND